MIETVDHLRAGVPFHIPFTGVPDIPGETVRARQPVGFGTGRQVGGHPRAFTSVGIGGEDLVVAAYERIEG